MLKLNKIISFFIIFFMANYSLAGNLQGGGGGRTNAAVKRYLDKRIYGLAGANIQVAPKIILTNACLDGNTIHTIEPVWQCAEMEDIEVSDKNNFGSKIKAKRCKKKVKDHLHKRFNPKQKICEQRKAKLVDGHLKNVCVKFSEDKFKKFKTNYQLDVYQLSIGDGGSPTMPRPDYDYFMRTIDYSIPTCDELNIN